MGSRRTAVKVGAVAAAAIALAGFGAQSASALPAADGVRQQVVFAGSDTTFDFVKSYAATWQASSSNNTGAAADILTVLPPVSSTNTTVPADANCGVRIWGPVPTTNPVNTPYPNGSSAGISALTSSAGASPANACVDVARSSRAKTGTDAASLRFFGFARDAVSVATYGAKINVTQAQLQDIYACRTTLWQNIPGSGKTGTIIRYIPQDGSGTRSFFISALLGGATPAANSAACPLITVQENVGTAVSSANQARAILPYSVAQWVYQNRAPANGAVDLTAGNFIDSIDGVSPTTGDGSTAAAAATPILNGTFKGARTVYNVLDTRTPAASYNAALRIVGFDSTGRSLLCNGSQAGAITAFGFVPFPSSGTGGTCR